MTASLKTGEDARSAVARDLFGRAAALSGAQREGVLNQIITLSMSVARSVAGRFRGRGEPVDDLVQVAYMGLTKAVRRFDPQRGHDFLAFAVPTVSGEVKGHFRDTAWTVRPPRRIQEMQARISTAAAGIAQHLGSSLAVPQGHRTLRRPWASMSREALTMLAPACRRLKPRDQRILFLRFFRGWTQSSPVADRGRPRRHPDAGLAADLTHSGVTSRGARRRSFGTPAVGITPLTEWTQCEVCAAVRFAPRTDGNRSR